MVVAALAPVFRQRFFGPDGLPLDGGKVWTYAAGSAFATPKATYRDKAEVAANTNPIILDDEGYCDLWLSDDGTAGYQIKLTDALDNVIWSVDNVWGGPYSSLKSYLDAIQGEFDDLTADTIPFAPGYAGSVAETVGAALRDFVTVKRFGAVCDGVTDDTVAVQKAYDYCAKNLKNITLYIPGKCYITSSIIVDRPVDNVSIMPRGTTGTQLTVGTGDMGGFYTDKNIKLFDSTLGDGTSPASNEMAFDNVRFEVSDPNLATTCFSERFLRMHFRNCYFQQIKLVTSSIYLQGWYFTGCTARFWKGVWFNCNNGQKAVFDGIFTDNTWEFGEKVFYGVPEMCNFKGNLAESIQNFYWAAGASAVSFIGNYFEGNSAPEWTMTDIPNGGVAYGISMMGNVVFAPATISAAEYRIVIGDVHGFVSMGNVVNANMFDMRHTRANRVLSMGDYCALQKFGPDGWQPASTALDGGPHYPREVWPEYTGLYSTGTTAFPGGLNVNPAVPVIQNTLNIISVCATAGDSVVLPSTEDMVAPDASNDLGHYPAGWRPFREFIIRNDGIASCTVWTNHLDLANFGLLMSWAIAPGAVIRLAQIGPGIAPVRTA